MYPSKTICKSRISLQPIYLCDIYERDKNTIMVTPLRATRNMVTDNILVSI